ncbi:hypothetical protein [Actinomadura algeriensis]|uniref:Lipoprotein n=1 Tax=Actinomadura algeriensis TaxID=1679523 RepID=A0ABR9JQL9_9ACTN|nr:hypothetical protein [Actinomadura algeriensis]MBE1532865.1 hypothetical protein [Actinomadura algeriensis]
MKGTRVTGVRRALWLVPVAVLAAGCGGTRVQSDDRPPRPGMPITIPPSGAHAPSPGTSTSAAPLPSDLPAPPRVDRKDATAVAKAALTIMYTVDSTVDTGLRDAKLRAVRFLTPGYTAEVNAAPRQYVPAEWHRHRAYLAVRLQSLGREAGAPSDGLATAYRQWKMTTTPTGRDRWRGSPTEQMVYMVLTKSSESEGWRVSDVVVDGDGQA